jgi:hypothetical protein
LNMDESAKTADKAKRVYLRISSNIAAYIFFKGKLVKKVFINDFSTTGVGFFVSGPQLPGNNFEIRFRLSIFSPPIKAQIVVRNTTPIHGGWRLGCSFEKISLADKNSVQRYLCSHTDYRAAYQVINLVAFLCLLDAMARAGLWAGLSYHEIFSLNRDVLTIIAPRVPFLFYLAYAFFSLLAFILSDKLFIKKGIVFLGFALLCLAPSLSFVLFKNMAYWEQGLFFSPEAGIAFFSWAYTIFLILAGLIYVNSLVSFGKARLNMENERLHRARS